MSTRWDQRLDGNSARVPSEAVDCVQVGRTRRILVFISLLHLKCLGLFLFCLVFFLLWCNIINGMVQKNAWLPSDGFSRFNKRSNKQQSQKTDIFGDMELDVKAFKIPINVYFLLHELAGE